MQRQLLACVFLSVLIIAQAKQRTNQPSDRPNERTRQSISQPSPPTDQPDTQTSRVPCDDDVDDDEQLFVCPASVFEHEFRMGEEEGIQRFCGLALHHSRAK